MPSHKAPASLLDDFTASLREFAPQEAQEYAISEIRAAEVWPWADLIGVYYFKNDSKGDLYVGRALPGTGFGRRIWSHLRAEDKEWQEDIGDASTVVGFLPVATDSWHLAAALELYLIDKLSPPHNSKRG